MPGTVLGARDHISTISKVDKACVSLSLYFSKKDKKIKEVQSRCLERAWGKIIAE